MTSTISTSSTQYSTPAAGPSTLIVTSVSVPVVLMVMMRSNFVHVVPDTVFDAPGFSVPVSFTICRDNLKKLLDAFFSLTQHE